MSSHAKLKAFKLPSPTSLIEREMLWRSAVNVPRKCPGSDVLELGTMCAVTTLFLADGLREGLRRFGRDGAKVVSVDNYSASERDPKLRSYDQNVAFVAEHGYSEMIELVKADSVEFISTLKDESLGMAFVDSWHVYEHVSKELPAIYPKLAPGALLCCHDFQFAHSGIVRAVNEFMSGRLEMLWGGTVQRLWWSIKTW